MSALAPAERDRLGACLALAEAAANPYDAERLAALAAAERLLGKHGLRLRDLGLRFAVVDRERHTPEPPRPHVDWRETARRCLARPGALRPWEAGFLASLLEFPRLSAKQRTLLVEIANRIGVAAG